MHDTFEYATPSVYHEDVVADSDRLDTLSSLYDDLFVDYRTGKRMGQVLEALAAASWAASCHGDCHD